MGRYRPPQKPGSKYITPEGFQRLSEELDYLWKIKRPQVTQTVREAAAQGDLEQRIDTSQYEGFFEGLGEGINKMMDAVVVPLREGTRVIGSLAEGDLTASMEGDFGGEYALLRDAINTSMDNLCSMVGEIRTASATIGSAASEIAQGNADLSQRTDQQASSLQETASSMEEMTATVRQNADNAREANQLAAAARDQAEKGGDVVGKAVTAMGEINTSSKKIADIISVIDEIAFQTNLLALNASVEAARAGEAGKGFAVVAVEVRRLAQSAAEASSEVKQLVEQSASEVGTGSKHVISAAEKIKEMIVGIQESSELMSGIAVASREQASSIDEVNVAVRQMDEMTQHNAALVEETNAAIEQTDNQVDELDRIVDVFKLDGEAERGSNPRAAEAA